MEYFIYSDASFDPKSGKGVSAILIHSSIDHEFNIQTKQINDENIARLEFMSAIWGLKEWKKNFYDPGIKTKLKLIVDCIAIKTLLNRRERLERTEFMSQKKKEVLANAVLYQKFLILYDELQPEIVWVRGHSPKDSRNDFQKVFSLVDKAARDLLRKKS